MFEWQNLDYGEAGKLVHERDPRNYNWGYFASDTLPQSGIGLFFWFESPEELLAFIAKIETQAFSDKEKAKKVKEAIKGFNLKGKFTTDLQRQLNNELNDIEIKWWGKFSDLCSGKNKFSRDLLKAYYGQQYNSSKPQPVYTPKFIVFCEDWGH